MCVETVRDVEDAVPYKWNLQIHVKTPSQLLNCEGVWFLLFALKCSHIKVFDFAYERVDGVCCGALILEGFVAKFV